MVSGAKPSSRAAAALRNRKTPLRDRHRTGRRAPGRRAPRPPPGRRPGRCRDPVRERVRHDVPRPQQPQDLLDGDRRVADVRHHRQAGRSPRLHRPGERHAPVRARERSVNRTLNPTMRSGCSRATAGRPLRVQVAQVVQLAQERVDLAHRGDVQERQDAPRERFDDVATEAGERVGARGPSVGDRGGATLQIVRAGRDREVRDAPVDVDVEVHEPRQHEQTGGVDGICRIAGRETAPPLRCARRGCRRPAARGSPRRGRSRSTGDHQVVRHPAALLSVTSTMASAR